MVHSQLRLLIVPLHLDVAPTAPCSGDTPPFTTSLLHLVATGKGSPPQGPIILITGAGRWWCAWSQLVAVRSEQRWVASGRDPFFCSQRAQDATSFRDVRARLAACPQHPAQVPLEPSHWGSLTQIICSEASASRTVPQPVHASVTRHKQVFLSGFQAVGSDRQKTNPKQPYLR